MSQTLRATATRLVLASLWTMLGPQASPQDGTGPLIDQRFYELKYNAFVSPLPEVPTDESPVPADWLAMACWNVQVGGVSTSAGAARPPLVGAALHKMFGGTYQLLAAQEVSGTGNADVLRGLLPGGNAAWQYSFFDTTDTQDNGVWRRLPVLIGDPMPLFVTGQTDSAGRIITDPGRAVHPPFAAHIAAGDFDFTLITLHLTFADGDTQESVRELRVLLDYLDSYFQQPIHDPDVIICGDFNTPSLLSGQTGKDGVTVDPIFDQDPRFQTGERRFVVTVHEPTSRSSAATGGMPANNYDHFVFSADVMEELIQARRVSTNILTDHPEDPEERLTSDHFPIVAFFKTRGAGIVRDLGFQAAIHSVVSSASFLPGVVSGSWVTIFGQDLASTTRIWRKDEVIDGVLPAELDGVRVNIGGKPASVYYVSPIQLNIQAPDGLMEGPAEVEVIRDGVRSATWQADVRRFAPGFFLFAQGGARYLAAVHAELEDDQIVYAGSRDLFDGAVPSRPAKPGDSLLLFGTGFGPTSPPVPAGHVFSGAAPLADRVTIRFGDSEAEVLFAGLSGAGLYQFNIIVPQGVPTGDVPVVAEIAGFQTQAEVYVTIE